MGASLVSGTGRIDHHHLPCTHASIHTADPLLLFKAIMSSCLLVYSLRKKRGWCILTHLFVVAKMLQ